MAFSTALILPLRIIQVVFAIIVLGVLAYGMNASSLSVRF
jgi:hypothetical protein